MLVSQRYEELNCSQCTPVKKTENGCERDSPIPGRWEIKGMAFQRCPLKVVTWQTWLAIRLFRQYEKGFLPVAGGILDQSAVFLQAVEVIQQTVKEREALCHKQ